MAGSAKSEGSVCRRPSRRLSSMLILPAAHLARFHRGGDSLLLRSRGFADPSAAQAYVYLSEQDKSAWSQELDLRPSQETF